MAKLVLLDGHSLAYRAFFALPPEMATKKGELTNAIFGFTVMLLDVLEKEKPDYIAVSFDVGKTWRHEAYAAYKGHRAKSPDELRAQVERIKELVKTFNIPIYTAEGWEADDVLGTLARQCEAEGVDVLIVTGDTDAHQLVTEKVSVQNAGRSFRDARLYTPADIRERYGLEAGQLPDYKAILGDKSDNIPGVAGIGDKGATQLLQSYETLENIYEHLDELKEGIRKKLEASREEAFISKKLAIIETHVPNVTLELAKSHTHEFDRGAVIQLFRDLEFHSLIEKIPASDGTIAEVAIEPDEPEIETDYRLITTEAELKEVGKAIAAAKGIAIDTETTSQNPMEARIVGISIGVGDGKAFYIPIGHRADLPSGQLSFDMEKPADPRNIKLETVVAWLNPLLARKGLEIYAHNAKYDCIVLEQHGFKVPNIHHDTLIGAWILNPGARNLGLKALAQNELNVTMTNIEELIGTGKNQITMDLVDVNKAAPYASADVDITCRLVPGQKERLEKRALYQLFHEHEMPLVGVLSHMEQTGVLFDPHALRPVHEQITTRLRELEEEIYKAAGMHFNINSPQQLSDILFINLGLDKKKSSKTQTGYYSTAVNVLENLTGAHPIVGFIMEQRTLQKLLSTYIDQLPRQVNPKTGRIHSDFSMIVAETGRLSSNNPNLQNIPVRTELGREIRRAFIAPTGYFLLAADYSQVELRVLAHLSGDEAMTEAFLRGEDIHAATANRLFGVPLKQVSRDQRRIAKIINFGLLYGMSAFRLAREAGIPYDEAEKVLQAYFASFPKVESYLNSVVQEAVTKGYVETILGRRRYFEVLQQNPTSNAGRAAERAAKNHPIQGSAAEIIKIAMVEIDKWLLDEGKKTRMVLQVHDELVFEVPETELDEVLPRLVDTMESAMTLTVPLKVDAKVGHNWLEMEVVEEQA
jgi:DNA polymerase I